MLAAGYKRLIVDIKSKVERISPTYYCDVVCVKQCQGRLLLLERGGELLLLLLELRLGLLLLFYIERAQDRQLLLQHGPTAVRRVMGVGLASRDRLYRA